MIYKNVEIFNVAELIDCEDGGVKWLRVPSEVDQCLEHGTQSYSMARCSTGVELRFVIKSGDNVVIRMAKAENDRSTSVFHVYRGGIQGYWDDCESDKYVSYEAHDFIIKKSENIDFLKKMAAACSDPWDPEVVRIIFDRGAYRIIDIIGDVEPPRPEQCPQKTILTYGSSITHGSNSIDMSHSWPAVLAHNLKMDVKNLGLAGACAMEEKMIDYIAGLGETKQWDMAIVELGINVLGWPDDKILSRASNAIKQVAGRNPDKNVYVISPFYCFDDFKGGLQARNWREKLKSIIDREQYPNVTYINGLDLLGDVSGLSADEVHPNIYGVEQIASRLTEIIKQKIK